MFSFVEINVNIFSYYII